MNIKEIIENMGEDPARCPAEVFAAMQIGIYTSAYGACIGAAKINPDPTEAKQRANMAVAHFNRVMELEGVKARGSEAEEEDDEPDEE